MYFFFLRRQDFSSQLSSSTMDWYSHCKHELTFWIFHFQSARTSSSGLGITSGYGGMVGRPDTASMVEAKYPALRFKQQLTAYVEKIYGIIRDNLKKEISPFLTLCIQAPRANRVRPSRGSLKSIHSNALSRQASSVHWQSIVKCLDNTLETMKNNHVSPILIFQPPYSQGSTEMHYSIQF